VFIVSISSEATLIAIEIAAPLQRLKIVHRHRDSMHYVKVWKVSALRCFLVYLASFMRLYVHGNMNAFNQQCEINICFELYRKKSTEACDRF